MDQTGPSAVLDRGPRGDHRRRRAAAVVVGTITTRTARRDREPRDPRPPGRAGGAGDGPHRPRARSHRRRGPDADPLTDRSNHGRYAIITEACIDVKDRACVDVCPVQCIYEFDPPTNLLFSEERGRQRRHREHARAEPGRHRHLRRQHPVREPRRVHLVHRLLPARRVPGRSDLLRGAPARRLADRRQVQRRRIPTRATTTPSSCSTAGTCSPTDRLPAGVGWA